MKAQPVMLGPVPVGSGHPAVFVAEVGTFFNQDVDAALGYVDAIAQAGTAVFKTEILHDPDICLQGMGLQHRYNHAGGTSTEDYRALIERKIVLLEDYARLFQACHDRGMSVVASVYDAVGVDFVAQHGGGALKVARNNVDNVPLIRCAAASGLPIIFDMGHVSLEEIGRAVGTARDAGSTEIIVNLHPGANPAPPEAHNLRTATLIKETLGVPVGLSCHYRGEEIMYAAVGIGIDLVEKGVDPDPDRPEQDLISAIPMRDLAAVLRRFAACSAALGSEEPDVPPSRDLTARAGLVARRDLQVGEKLIAEAVGWAFPPVGIPAVRYDDVVDRPLRLSVRRGEPITWDHLDVVR